MDGSELNVTLTEAEAVAVLQFSDMLMGENGVLSRLSRENLALPFWDALVSIHEQILEDASRRRDHLAASN